MREFEIEIRQPIDYIDVIRLESRMKKIARAANAGQPVSNVVAFPLKLRKPWLRPPKSGSNAACRPRPAA